MSDTEPVARTEHRLDQLIWQLARIEGQLADLRKALNAFRSDIVMLRKSSDDAA